jgi:hypothetical protein
MTDTGQELAVKKQNIDSYADATRPVAKQATGNRPRKMADWEYVHPPSGRKYTTSGKKARKSVGKKR